MLSSATRDSIPAVTRVTLHFLTRDVLEEVIELKSNEKAVKYGNLNKKNQIDDKMTLDDLTLFGSIYYKCMNC